MSVNSPTTFGGDDAKRACQRGLRDSLLPPVAVDEEARDPPVGRSRTQPVEPSHSARELGGGPKLAPPDDVRPVVDKGGMGPIRLDKPLLQFPVAPGPPVFLNGLEVEGDAPAAAPYTIVFLYNSHEVRPRLPSEFLDYKLRHRLS